MTDIEKHIPTILILYIGMYLDSLGMGVLQMRLHRRHFSKH